MIYICQYEYYCQITLLILVLDIEPDKLSKIDFTVDGYESFTVKPIMGSESVYCSRNLQPVPNSIPVTIHVSQEQLSEVGWRPTEVEIEMGRQECISRLKAVRRQRKEVSINGISSKVVSEMFPELKGIEKRRLIERYNKELTKRNNNMYGNN